MSFPNILADFTENKKISHLKLQSLVCDFGSATVKNFTKKQLLDLSNAYSLKVSSKSDKKTNL